MQFLFLFNCMIVKIFSFGFFVLKFDSNLTYFVEQWAKILSQPIGCAGFIQMTFL